MDYQELNRRMEQDGYLDPGTGAYETMASLAFEAEKLTAEINTGYHEPEKRMKLFERLFGHELPQNIRIAPPFYTDYGKNIWLGEGVFINCACQFQDQGKISIGKDSLIGPKVVIATINHGLSPDKRRELRFSPVIIGENVWIGASAVILPGVTIGDNCVIGAGAVVNKDIPKNSVAVGVPAKIVRTLE